MPDKIKSNLHVEHRSQPCVHFVGFRGDEYSRAVLVFGPPDYIHRTNDLRLWQEVVPNDLVVLANGCEERTPHPHHSFNDSEHF